jgi:hypothetical protein
MFNCIKKIFFNILKPICIPIAIYNRHKIRELKDNNRIYRFLYLWLKDSVDGDIYDSRVYKKILKKNEYKLFYNKLNKLYKSYCRPGKLVIDNYKSYPKANEFSLYFFIMVYTDNEIKYNFDLKK